MTRSGSAILSKAGEVANESSNKALEAGAPVAAAVQAKEERLQQQKKAK
jgi:hypothetical protein